MIRSRIGRRQAIFHRAFDVTPNPFRALEELIDLGLTRVLTSGQCAGAPEGSELIRQLIERADGRIEMLPGAGIGIGDVRELVAATGCTQVHMTAFSERHDSSTQSNPQLRFGDPASPPESTYEMTDFVLVQQMKEKLRALVSP
jgi:copper homeostasis protein